MKTSLATLGFTLALASAAFSQTKPVDIPGGAPDSVKTIAATRMADAMKNLPEGVAEKIAAAREAAKAAKADVDAMKAQGKTPEEIQALITEKKTAALANLQKALDALNGLPEGAKERVGKASETVSKRLTDRKSETP